MRGAEGPHACAVRRARTHREQQEQEQEPQHIQEHESVSSSGGAGAVFPPLDDIADSLGLTIETVSRQLGALRDLGLLRTSGRSVVLLIDIPGIEARAGHLPAAARSDYLSNLT